MPDTQADRGKVASEISNSAVQLLRDYTGRGPTKAHTIINRDVVTIVFRDTLTKGERKLVSGGFKDEVLHTRHMYQGAMRDDLVALVERNCGRKVVAFMSDNHIDPDIGVEFFILESHAGAQGDGAGPAEPVSTS
jgi:uncharacterized protein YbcI